MSIVNANIVNADTINTSNANLDALTVSNQLSSGTLICDDIQTTSLNGGQLAGFRNKVMNGDFLIWQRGTSFVSPATGSYLADRFVWVLNNSTGAVTITRDTDVPSDNEFQYSLKVDVTTADTTLDAADSSSIQQRIEGFLSRSLIGRTFTVSFWVKSALTGVYCVSVGNSIFDRSYAIEYTINTANTWEKKSVTFTGGLITAGTWDWTNGVGFTLRFALSTGTDRQGTAGSWQSANVLGTSSQVNFLNNTANNFWITGVQLEPGPVATPFEHRNSIIELDMVKRYYEQLQPNNNTLYLQSTSSCYHYIQYITKRGTPTVSFQSSTATIIYNNTTTGSVTVTYGTEQVLLSGSGIVISAVPGSPFTGGQAGRVQIHSIINIDSEL